jgi:hypothetical protein
MKETRNVVYRSGVWVAERVGHERLRRVGALCAGAKRSTERDIPEQFDSMPLLGVVCWSIRDGRFFDSCTAPDSELLVIVIAPKDIAVWCDEKKAMLAE